MAFLPNNPNGVNVAPSANTKPEHGFWGERKVTWLKVTGSYTLGGTLYANAFEKPWSMNGYTEVVTNVIESRGTILGMYNDQPAPDGSGQPDSAGEGGTLFIALGYAAGYFTPGAIVSGTVATVGAPVTVTGTIPDPADPLATIDYVDPVCAEIVSAVLTGYIYAPASLTITVGYGFQVV